MSAMPVEDIDIAPPPAATDDDRAADLAQMLAATRDELTRALADLGKLSRSLATIKAKLDAPDEATSLALRRARMDRERKD